MNYFCFIPSPALKQKLSATVLYDATSAAQTENPSWDRVLLHNRVTGTKSIWFREGIQKKELGTKKRNNPFMKI